MIAEVDLSNVYLETERLILRPWRMRDVADFYAYASMDGLGQMAGWQPHKSIEESEAVLSMFIAAKKVFALELKENGRVIGSIGLEVNELLRQTDLLGREIGYALSKDYWGQGLMPEAVKRVIRYCFEELDLDVLYCAHFHWNQQSRRVIEKCGFEYLKDSVFETQDGRQEPERVYRLLNPLRT